MRHFVFLIVAAFVFLGCGSDSGTSGSGSDSGGESTTDDGGTTAATDDGGTTATDGGTPRCDKLMSERAVGYDVGVMVPDMTLSNCSGDKLSLHEALCNKKAAMIYFASGWCQPCAEKMPKLESLHQKYGNEIEIWVAMRENTGPQDPATKYFCQEWTDEYELSFPVVIDPTDKHTGNFLTAGSTFPVIVMVDSSGTIQAIETGGDVDLEAYVQALVE